jgi:hypothetical protein
MNLSSKRLSFVILVIAGAVTLFSQCIQPGPAKTADPRGLGYAGMAACVSCHTAIGHSYLHGAHALTSRVADRQSVLGSFAAPGNEFIYGPGRKVVLEQRDSGLYQVAISNDGDGGAGKGADGHGGGGGGRVQEAERFDIAVGSGRKAQTYLYWKGDGVFQLPVSYFLTEHSWANSPHYPVDTIWFGRAVAVDCFECHSSFIGVKPMIRTDAFHGTPQYDRAQLTYGIDCERCHGPGALHAAWQAEHPEDRVARYMASFSSLTRQQRLDVCAACHSGAHEGQQRNVFRFKPGDTLANYYFADPRMARGPEKTDVHGNQYQMLVASQCFLRSKTLECGSCHNPHVRERDSLTVFATRCMNCHGGGDMVGVHAKIGEGAAGVGRGAGNGAGGGHARMKVDSQFLIRNCIDCHMPARASATITMLTQGQKDPVADLVRSHYITVYPDETKRRLEMWRDETKRRLAIPGKEPKKL